MTEQYDPRQNAIAERVNGILKQVFLINTKRPHMSCQLLTQEQMHKQCKIKRKTYKKKISQQTAVC